MKTDTNPRHTNDEGTYYIYITRESRTATNTGDINKKGIDHIFNNPPAEAATIKAGVDKIGANKYITSDHLPVFDETNIGKTQQ